MKALIIFLIFISAVAPAFAETPVIDDIILVEFPSTNGIKYGFSSSRVNTIAPPDNDIANKTVGTVEVPLEMSEVVATSQYSTQPFFFYLQVFEKGGYKVDLTGCTPLTNSDDPLDVIHFSNIGSDTSGVFSGSSNFTSVCLGNIGSSNFPRVFYCGFEFVVNFADVDFSKDGIYIGSITITVTGV